MIISFDLKADGAVFKKPDVNEGLYLSYNTLHKPALLGILGAVLGLRGFGASEEFPEYYQVLSKLKVSIAPIADRSDKGNFTKFTVQYNNGVGYASQEQGGNLIVKEQTLFAPGYRCYVQLDMVDLIQQQLAESLQNGEAVFPPYLGKNEFPAWWDNVQVWEEREFGFDQEFRLNSLFVKQSRLQGEVVLPKFSFKNLGKEPTQQKFLFFERLPLQYSSVLRQYKLAEFAYTNHLLATDSTLTNLYQLTSTDIEETPIIQLY